MGRKVKERKEEDRGMKHFLKNERKSGYRIEGIREEGNDRTIKSRSLENISKNQEHLLGEIMKLIS